jgi:hypothetical protein
VAGEFETRPRPCSLIATRRGFTFHVAGPISSVQESSQRFRPRGCDKWRRKEIKNLPANDANDADEIESNANPSALKFQKKKTVCVRKKYHHL